MSYELFVHIIHKDTVRYTLQYPYFHLPFEPERMTRLRLLPKSSHIKPFLVTVEKVAHKGDVTRIFMSMDRKQDDTYQVTRYLQRHGWEIIFAWVPEKKPSPPKPRKEKK